jgi:hypothetical protein
MYKIKLNNIIFALLCNSNEGGKFRAIPPPIIIIHERMLHKLIHLVEGTNNMKMKVWVGIEYNANAKCMHSFSPR